MNKTNEQLQAELRQAHKDLRMLKDELKDAVKLNDKLTEFAVTNCKIRKKYDICILVATALALALGLALIYANSTTRERDSAVQSMNRCWEANLKQDQMMKQYEQLVIRYGKRYGKIK